MGGGFDHVECVGETGVGTRVAFRLVENGAVNEDKIAWFTSFENVVSFVRSFGFGDDFWVDREFFKPRSTVGEANETLRDRCCEMGSRKEGQRAVAGCAFLEGDPKSEGRRRIGVLIE